MMRAALLLLGTAAAPTPAAVPGSGFDVTAYRVALRPDLATAMLSGEQRITVRATRNGVHALSFSPNALRITAAQVDGAPVAVEQRADALVLPLPHQLRRGEQALVGLSFAGRPARGVTKTAGGLYAGYFACDWMVCLQDAPGDKARFTLDLYLPAGATSLASGLAHPARAVGDGLVLHRWRSTQAYSPYLYAFAAGYFDTVTTRTHAGTFTLVDATGQGIPRELPTQSAEIAAFLADRAGMPLPQRRYAQLLVPGNAAQEAATFSLIGRHELAGESDDPSSAWIVAHEMAHQWWGNLVTCATWRDFWLNEGVTTFMVAAWKQHRFGGGAYQRELAQARMRVDRARAAGYDKPLAWGGRYPSLSLRRAVQYSKGALFMDTLRRSMGDDAFWRGLRRYTRQHRGGTVTSRDLQQAMQASTPRDLSTLFDEWVYDPE